MPVHKADSAPFLIEPAAASGSVSSSVEAGPISLVSDPPKPVGLRKIKSEPSIAQLDLPSKEIRVKRKAAHRRNNRFQAYALINRLNVWIYVVWIIYDPFRRPRSLKVRTWVITSPIRSVGHSPSTMSQPG